MSGSEPDKGIFRHPLTIVVISFLLTVVLGALLTQWIARETKLAEQNRAEVENNKTGVQNLSRYIYERRTRAVMLHSAILRQAQLEEIKERKRLYDDAYVRWNSNVQANSFMIRDVLKGETYSFIESAVQTILVEKIFSPLDKCLTLAYDEVASGRSGTKIVEECKAAELLGRSLRCGYIIPNELYKLSSRSITKEEACKSIGTHCSGDEPFDEKSCLPAVSAP
jgi:hypothetical protein